MSILETRLGASISFFAVPVTVIRFAIVLIVGGFISYFFHHHILWAALISGIGYVFLVVGVILWSVEKSGDVSFS